ncbi:MAG: CidA/LrgA family protein [Spirochaetaceae bacterium]|jgi:holin-like protein|nr:CidA/LrgA family protein [Spirochaetaceae bacterium]
MKILRQLALILLFGFAGEILSRCLPLGMPASVWGLILMLGALGVRILKPEHLGEAADYLSANMSFFFLPAAVTILENFEVFRPVLFRFVLICCAAAVVTFGVTYGTVRFIRIILERRS